MKDMANAHRTVSLSTIFRNGILLNEGTNAVIGCYCQEVLAELTKIEVPIPMLC